MLTGDIPWPDEFVERYRRAGYWSDQTLTDLLRSWSAGYGDHVAVIDGHRRVTYRALEDRVGRLAGGLRERSIERDSDIVVHLPNSLEFLLVCFALFRLGARPVLALPAHRRSEIRHLCEVSGATGYIARDRFQGFDHRELARELTSSIPDLHHVFICGDSEEFTALEDVDGDPEQGPGPDPGDVAFFLLSGGTTGPPKLIPRTHRDYAYNVGLSASNAGLGPDDVYLAVLPVAHNYALGCPGVLGTLATGGTVVMSPTPSPDDAFELIARERVTVTGLVPPLALLWCELAGTADLSSLRLLQVGGAKLTPEGARRIGCALDCRLQQSFGMAEGLLSQSAPGDSAELTSRAQGRPLSPGDEIRIVDEEDRGVAPGEVGRLLTRGPYTIRGYYRAEAYNARAFTEDGFLRTGDLVRRLPSGHLVVEGRVTDTINRGGDKVAPDELEDHLLQHPGVVDVAVAGVPDAVMGERTCAWVVARDPALRLPEIARFLRECGVAAYKIPDRLELLDALPHTGIGKVDRARLPRRAVPERRRP